VVQPRRLFLGIIFALLVCACGGSSSSHTDPERGGRTIEYRVPNPGMEPTIRSGSRLTIDEGRVTPRLGEIVAFHPPTTASPTKLVCGNINQGPGQPLKEPCGTPAPRESRMVFVERIVGLPGDRIAVVGGHVVRNGAKQREPYTAPCGGVDECDLPKPIGIPPGHFFLMADNRGAANDSRFWGPIPGAWIIGTVRR
jgi:signal peptidase I